MLPANSESVSSLDIGHWVKHKAEGGFGIVGGVDGNEIFVNWSGGFGDTQPLENLEPSSPDAYFDAISQYAQEQLKMTEQDLWSFHMPLANGRDKFSFEVLSQLEAKLLDYDGTWKTIESTAEAVEAAPEVDAEVQSDSHFVDIFAQYAEAESQPADDAQDKYEAEFFEDCRREVIRLLQLGAKIDASRIMRDFGFPLNEAFAHIETLSQLTEDEANTTLTELMKKLQASVLAANAAFNHSVHEAAQAQKAPETNKHGVTFEENITPIKQPDPIKTEAGLIDPETGEILQPSLIMRKFGWTELPVLPPDPTKEEVAAFQAKLDQVLDVILNLKEQTERWTAANDIRCKPLEEVAQFWEEAFLIPQSKMLAPYGLPTYKSGQKIGQYSSKSLTLPSGCIDFTKVGGWKVFNPDLVKAQIAKEGIQKYACIDAKLVVSYNHDKLIACLKNGTIKSMPGTEKKNEDEFGKVTVVSAAKKLAEKQAAKEKREATKKAKAEQAQPEESTDE